MKIPKYTLKIVCILLIITNLVVFYFYRAQVAKHVVEDYTDKYTYLDPHRKFHNLDDLIVNVQPLREYLKSLPEANKEWAELSIYFEVLDTGANISVNTDLKIWPASLAKLPVGMITMKKVEKGIWDLENTKFELVAEDADLHTPDIQKEIGKSFTVKFLLERMLLDSDNTAYHMLVRNMTEEELVSIANAVGLEELFTRDMKISAKEYTRLFRALHTATYLNEDNSQYLLELLTDARFDKFLRAGLPDEVKLAHKWGINEVQNVYANSGIIYIKGRSYMLSVMVQGKGKNQKQDQENAERLIQEISKRSYEYVSSYKKVALF